MTQIWPKAHYRFTAGGSEELAGFDGGEWGEGNVAVEIYFWDYCSLAKWRPPFQHLQASHYKSEKRWLSEPREMGFKMTETSWGWSLLLDSGTQGLLTHDGLSDSAEARVVKWDARLDFARILTR